MGTSLSSTLRESSTKQRQRGSVSRRSAGSISRHNGTAASSSGRPAAVRKVSAPCTFIRCRRYVLYIKAAATCAERDQSFRKCAASAS